jgi:hypothetical protein
VLVFVAGGIAYSELRGLHDVMSKHKREIVMGGTYVVRPKDMLRSVSCLDKDSATTFATNVQAQEQKDEEQRRLARTAPQEQYDVSAICLFVCLFVCSHDMCVCACAYMCDGMLVYWHVATLVYCPWQPRFIQSLNPDKWSQFFYVFLMMMMMS